MEQTHLILQERYVIQTVLGRGGFATTYLAEDTRSGHSVAIKCLSFEHIDEWKTWELAEREAKVLKHLHHPQIPDYIDFFTREHSDQLEVYLVQEFVEGKNLAQWVKEGRHFSETEVVRIALSLAGVLEYLQHRSPPIIHRDIKPSNIILTYDNRPYLIDFGAVRDQLLSERTRLMGGVTIVGTYGYMPLEQFEGRPVPNSDIFSLGMTLIYLLSHREPADIDKKGLKLNFRPVVHISAGFARILDKMIEPDHTRRYPSATALKRDLENLQQRRVPYIPVGTPKFWLPVLGVILLFLVLMVRPDRPPVAPEDTPSTSNITRQSSRSTENTPAPEYKPTIPEGNPVVKGQLRFDGQPVHRLTSAIPRFWFRNEDSGKAYTANAVYLGESQFAIYDLPAGRFGISVNIDANPANPSSYPGDFRAWEVFQVTEQRPLYLEIDLQQIIRLLAPQDNDRVLKGWGAVCDNEVVITSPVTFRWESLGEGVYYDYAIQLIGCPYESKRSIAGETTPRTTLELNLPPNAANEFYLLTLYARKNGRRIGMLMTHGANGYGWDYRFRVR
ncbi:MAG: serine/threonine protein kinase [Gemmatimonadetes bacterium]|nr:MAG: serine/threonine protein kinase [Gemmatimonadota bacterium]